MWHEIAPGKDSEKVALSVYFIMEHFLEIYKKQTKLDQDSNLGLSRYNTFALTISLWYR